MGLNIVSQGGDFDPWVKFNGKAGRWYIKGADGAEQEIANPTFVADFANIKTGWINFVAGMAPDRVWDKSITEPTAKPSEAHKRGFSLRLFSKASFGGVCELSSSSMHLCNAISELYDQFEKEIGAHKGELPVVQCTGATPQKDKMGTNYKPTFAILKWVPRPAELDGAAGDTDTAPAPKAAAPVAQKTVSEF
jgi:hypothetical protein